MTARRSTLAGVTFAILSLSIEAQSPDGTAVDWAADGDSIGTLQLSLGGSGKRDIITLAAAMGLMNPARVELDAYVPGVCPFVRVRSVVVDEGNRRSWLDLRMRPREWRSCHQSEPGATVTRVGRWIAVSSELSLEERWRVHDGDDWFVDIELDVHDIYPDAETIVKAIRRDALVNRVPPIDLGPGRQLTRDLPQLMADDVSSVRRDAEVPGGYVVRVGRRAGEILYVRVVSGTVEVYGLSSWMV
jgi:hypothetical protein